MASTKQLRSLRSTFIDLGWQVMSLKLFPNLPYVIRPRAPSILYFEHPIGLKKMRVWISFWDYQELKGGMTQSWLWLVGSPRWPTSFYFTRVMMLLTLHIYTSRRLSIYMMCQGVLSPIETPNSFPIFGGTYGDC